MGVELDPLDDIFADENETVKKVRPRGRFQPKLKKKGIAAAKLHVETAKPLEDGKKDLASESCENIAKDNNADIFVGLDALGEFLPHDCENMGGGNHPSELVSENPTTSMCNEGNLPMTRPELPVDEDPFSAAHPISSSTDGCGDLNKESVSEEIDITEALDMSATTITFGQKTGKFRPKPKTQKQNKMQEANTSVSYSLGLESIPPDTAIGDKDLIPALQDDVLDQTDIKEALDMSAISTSGQKTGKFCPRPEMEKQNKMQEANIPASDSLGSELIPPNTAIADKDLIPTLQDDVLDQIDIVDALDMSATANISGQKTGKFRPKPKTQKQNKMQEANAPVSDSLGSKGIPPDTAIGDKDSVPTLQDDDVIDLSLLGFAQTSPAEKTSELPLNDESLNSMEIDHLVSKPHGERVPEIPAKLQQESSTSNQVNETGRSLRPRKFNQSYNELVDEEVLGNASREEENIDSGSESQKKKANRKSRKLGDDRENPSKKRKAKETTDQGAPRKPKKFSHSTRRRRVDKALLEIPEDEFDHEKVALRDLILLAEHKEREMKKEEATARASATKQSNGNKGEHYSEDGTFISKQDGDFDDAEPSEEILDNTEYFNYQTFMNRTPAKRWSKQETELFYEAIQQFGTDLSMIQQLFPGRTRNQVKAKYKKEERQRPLRLREALTNRSTNNSHFQKVIELLKKLAAEKGKQNVGEDESIDLTGDEEAEEENLEANEQDGEAKNELVEEKENKNVVSDDFAVETESPLRADDDGDGECEEDYLFSFD